MHNKKIKGGIFMEEEKNKQEEQQEIKENAPSDLSIILLYDYSYCSCWK